MLESLLFLVSAQAIAASASAVEIDEPNPKEMKQSEIREFNAKLARNHPYYIRCVKSADTGSIVKRNFSCRTNEQWQKAEAVGNDNARDIMDRMGPKSTNTSG